MVVGKITIWQLKDHWWIFDKGFNCNQNRGIKMKASRKIFTRTNACMLFLGIALLSSCNPTPTAAPLPTRTVTVTGTIRGLKTVKDDVVRVKVSAHTQIYSTFALSGLDGRFSHLVKVPDEDIPFTIDYPGVPVPNPGEGVSVDIWVGAYINNPPTMRGMNDKKVTVFYGNGTDEITLGIIYAD